MRRGSWTPEGLVTAFLGGETLDSLCKRVGASPNTVRRVLKEQLGEEQFRSTRDRNDPKQSTASESELLEPFHTNEAFKDVASRIGVGPNTLRSKWVQAFGKEAFDARSKRLHSDAGTRAGLSWKGKTRVTTEQYRERDVARGSDHWCEVCGGGFVGYQALTHHMVRAGDEAHTKALEMVRAKVEDEKWAGLQEGVDYVVCPECGLRGVTLTGHLRTHGLDTQSFRVKWPDCLVWASKAAAQHQASLVASSTDQSYGWTVDDLKPFADEAGAIIVAKAAASLGSAQITVLHYCRKLGLRTRNKLAWQRLVLDKAAEFLGPYQWEWADPKLYNSATGRPFNYDGYFPAHQLVIEAHGDQHFKSSESWHGTLDEFHRLRAIDVLKKEMAQAHGIKVITVRHSDPVHDDSFWTALLGGSSALWEHLSESAKWTKVNDTLLGVRMKPFPVVPPNETELKKALTRIHKLVPYLDAGRQIHPYSTIGTAACASFFPNRYHAKRQGDRSAWDMWHNDASLRKAIRLQLDSGHPTTPERVLKAVVMFSRTPSVFRPAVAKYVYENYCPKGGVVWDPCAGYGGRLLGAMAAGVGRYIGTDLEPETAQGNQALVDALECKTSCRIECADATTFDPGEALDLVFTSPPYFDLEVYGKKFEASLRGSSVEQWVQSFLGSVVARAAQRLKSGGFLVLNLPQKPVGGLRLDLAMGPLVQLAGLTPLEPVYMPVRSFKKGMKREPLLVWQKP